MNLVYYDIYIYMCVSCYSLDLIIGPKKLCLFFFNKKNRPTTFFLLGASLNFYQGFIDFTAPPKPPNGSVPSPSTTTTTPPAPWIHRQKKSSGAKPSPIKCRNLGGLPPGSVPPRVVATQLLKTLVKHPGKQGRDFFLGGREVVFGVVFAFFCLYNANC